MMKPVEFVVSKRFNMTISIVINADTRDGFDQDTSSTNGLFSGCKSVDFLVEGVKNKIAYFEGFDKEVIVYVDVHNLIPTEVYWELEQIADTIVLRKHTSEPLFNDSNYVRALQLASGDYIAHFDQDCAAFTESKQGIEYQIGLLEKYKYVSYPSYWSPNPVDDKSFDGLFWASTRYFMCKRETLDFEEIKKCFDYNYYIDKYKPARACPWTEHWLGAIAGKGNVFYPPINELYTVFCWNNYKTGTLAHLNGLPYNEVINFINGNGGLHYPADLTLR